MIYKKTGTRTAEVWLCRASDTHAALPEGLPADVAAAADRMGGQWVLSPVPFWPTSGCGWCFPLKRVSSRQLESPEVFGTPAPVTFVGVK